MRKSKTSKKSEFYDYIMGLLYKTNKDSKTIVDNNLIYQQIDKDKCKLIGYKPKSKIKPKILIPDKIQKMQVVSIGERAFSEVDDLEEIILPEGLVEICPRAFSWCKNLENVVFPSTLKSIGYWAFECCSKLFRFNKNIFEIPDNLEVLGHSSFADCYSIEKVIIGRHTKYIGNGCFAGNHKLKYVSFEKNKTVKLGTGVFYNCISLKTTSNQFNMSTI